MVKDIFDLLDALGLVGPKILLRILETACLDCLDSFHGIVAILPPLQLLLQEVHNDEVETPQVISSAQVDIVVGVEAGETDSAAEISLPSGPERVLVVVEMLFGQSKINNVDFFEILRKHKV